MYADRLLGHFVRTNMEDVLAHVVVSRLSLKGLVIALHQDFVALFKCEQQDLILGGRKQAIIDHSSSFLLLLSSEQIAKGFYCSAHTSNSIV